MHAYAVYGADTRRWPPAASRWLDEAGEGGDAELAKVRQEARELDRLLDVARIAAAFRPKRPGGPSEAILSGEAQGADGGDVVTVDFSPKAAHARRSLRHRSPFERGGSGRGAGSRHLFRRQRPG